MEHQIFLTVVYLPVINISFESTFNWHLKNSLYVSMGGRDMGEEAFCISSQLLQDSEGDRAIEVMMGAAGGQPGSKQEPPQNMGRQRSQGSFPEKLIKFIYSVGKILPNNFTRKQRGRERNTWCCLPLIEGRTLSHRKLFFERILFFYCKLYKERSFYLIRIIMILVEK